MNQTIGRISIKEKIGYSLGDTASNLFFQTFMLFLMYFYTDVFGIPAAAVGTMFLITRVWDAINDPMMGMLADRTNTRWGKFRPYLLWFALPFGIIGVLTFTTPNLGATGKLIYAYITYTMMMMVYTAINVPYSALMGVITPNSLERTEISSYRFVAAFIGGLIVQASVMTLVKKFGGTNEALGWQGAMAILSGLAVVLFLITFVTTKERVYPPKEQRSSLGQDLSDLFQNVPWLLIGITSVLQLMFISIRNGSIMYYFKYYVQDQALSFRGETFNFSFESIASTFMLAGTVMTILGAILTKWFTKTFDKRNSYVGFILTSAIFIAVFYPLKPENLGLMFLFQVLGSFGMGVLAVLQWAMFTDTADYSEWRNHRRATGLVMSASLFAIKFGLAIGGTILGWVLAYYGFQANQPQTVETLHGIRLIMSIYPAILAVGCAVIMLFYPLNNAVMVEIEEELRDRRE